MQFRVLGPVEVLDGARRVPVAGQPRVVLAVLLLNANRVVSVDRLVECLWGDHPPANARRLLHGCVAQLRRLLTPAAVPAGDPADPAATPDASPAGAGPPPASAGPPPGSAGSAGTDPGSPLLTRTPGYVLQVGPGELDLTRFEELTGAAAQMSTQRSGEDLELACSLLSEALSLWHGPAADGVTLHGFAAEAAALDERRLTVFEERVDLDLRLGRHRRLVGELQAYVRGHPLRERPWAQLMVALAGTDRQADALAAYQQLRATLVDQLGIEPGAMLRQLHQVVLAGGDTTAAYLRTAAEPPAAEPEPDPTPTDPVPVVAGPPPQPPGHRPAQLPLDVYGFAGREPELGALDAMVAAGGQQPTAVMVAVVCGSAGVGKTALAVHWAHRVSARFPDGQLYANLRGYDPGGPAVPAHAAMRGFLDALGVPTARIPADLTAQAALFRSALAGRRMLVVLDNAATVEQVRPLLPGSPGCVVIVTSRDQLSGLVAVDGARPLTLDVLSAGEAHALLAGRLGGARLAAEPDAVAAIVAGCARLPLALAVVAARAATRPQLALAALAGQLRPAGRPATDLDPFADSDPSGDLRTVFSCSYRALEPAAARLFRLLGLHTGPDIAEPAAASLAGVPVARMRPLLDQLLRGHLLTESAPGRYTFHDLLRAYAAELAREHDSEADRRAAVTRLLDHYLHCAHPAALLVSPHRDPITLNPPLPGAVVCSLPDPAAAMAWFDTEHLTLLAAIDLAGTAGFDQHVLQLAWTMPEFLDFRGHWQDLVDLQRTALAAAQRLGDRAEQSRFRRSLGYAYSRLGRYQDAHRQLRQALALNRELGDVTGEAHSHRLIAHTLEAQGEFEQALGHAQQALAFYRAADHLIGQARVLNMIGWYHTNLGDHQEALAQCRAALRLSQQIGHPPNEAATWDSLGHAHHHLGQYGEAVDCYQHALALYRQVGDRHREAGVLDYLGDTRYGAGDPAAARAAWRQALAILDDLRHPDADGVRAKLYRRAEAPAGAPLAR